MDITLSNFSETLPEVLEAIDSCDFIAVDGEFTGLRNGPDVTAYDTPSLYYTKLRDGSLNFLLIQVGLCTFKFDHLKEKYIYKAFNFYVFPRSVHKSNDVNFLCQSSSINFLCSSGFDFNKLFKEGIPYLNIADEEILQEELAMKYENLNQSESMPKISIPAELLSTIEDACSRIEGFLCPENKEKEITFEKCNGFVRKLIFQTAYERFSTKNFNLSTKWVDNNAILVARKGKSKAEQNKENYEKDKTEITEAIGFSKIIKHISNSKKLIVGHNMLLDICHIVNRFCWPLPADYWEFKEMVHQLFPRLIDTKYMCSAYPFRDLIPSSVMNHMVTRLREPPFGFVEAVAANSDYSYSKDNDKAHEAGYDAYMTGLSFISLTTYLGKKYNSSSLQLNQELLKPFENRLFIMRIIDYSYVNLKGDEPKPTRNHVFHITFPKEWKTTDIVQLFSPYGDVYVHYCNQVSAWVTLKNQEKFEDVVSDLIESNLKKVPGLRKPFTLITWKQFFEDTSETRNSSVISNQRAVSSVSINTSSKSSPICRDSPTVSRSSGDTEAVDLEKKYSNNVSDIVESISRKRKKNDECLNSK